MMQEELIDVVDEHDEVVDVVPRHEIFDKNLICRVVNVFIRNTKGQLWIPRRTVYKKKFPLCLDMSMGGFVSSGETYEKTLARELLEELNIDVRKIDCKLLGYLSPYKYDISAFMKVYEISSDDTPNYNKQDFVEYKWLYPEELLKLEKQGEKLKGDLIPLVNIFYTK